MNEHGDNHLDSPGRALDRLLRHRIQGLASLPPLPNRSQELLHLLADPDLSIVRLIEIIELSPSLAARVIGVANSAFFASASPVTNVSDAVIRVLGLGLVRDLCLSQVLGVPFNTQECPSFDAVRFWRHAMATATLAPVLAGYATEVESDSLSYAYLAGLMHGLGMLVLAHVAPGSMDRVLRDEAVDDAQTLSDRQTDILGLDYAQAGGEIAKAWHLPAPIVVALDHHRDTEYRSEFWPLVSIVGLADRIARARTSAGTDGEDPDQHRVLLDKLGVSASNTEAALVFWKKRLDSIERLANTFNRTVP